MWVRSGLTVRYNYQNIAFSTEFQSSAQISTVAVVRAITAAAGKQARLSVQKSTDWQRNLVSAPSPAYHQISG